MSRIEIVYEVNGEEKRTVIQPSPGKEFTGTYSRVWCHGSHCSIEFEFRPLPTAKEQRAPKIHEVLSELLKSFCHGDNYDAPRMINARTKMEAIFAEYSDEEKL